MKDESQRMKILSFNFILPPSSFILAFGGYDN